MFRRTGIHQIEAAVLPRLSLAFPSRISESLKNITEVILLSSVNVSLHGQRGVLFLTNLALSFLPNESSLIPKTPSSSSREDPSKPQKPISASISSEQMLYIPLAAIKSVKKHDYSIFGNVPSLYVEPDDSSYLPLPPTLGSPRASSSSSFPVERLFCFTSRKSRTFWYRCVEELLAAHSLVRDLGDLSFISEASRLIVVSQSVFDVQALKEVRVLSFLFLFLL